MTLLDHVVLQVDDLNAIGDWYDQVVSLAGGTRTFDMPTLIGYALPGQPTQSTQPQHGSKAITVQLTLTRLSKTHHDHHQHHRLGQLTCVWVGCSPSRHLFTSLDCIPAGHPRWVLLHVSLGSATFSFSTSALPNCLASSIG